MSAQARTYRAVWFANLIAEVGMMSFIPFFPSIVTELGLEDRGQVALWAGLCQGAAPLMAAVMGPFWGAFGDRFGRKPMVLRSLLALCVFVGAMHFARTPFELFLLRLGQGSFSGFLPPSVALVSSGVPRERQGRVAGDLHTAMALGAIAGPLLGGLLVPWLGVRPLFLVVAVLTGLGALAVALCASEPPRPAGAPARAAGVGLVSLLQGTCRDLVALWSNPRTRAGLVLLFATQVGIGATNPQLELFVRDLGPEGLGLTVEQGTGLLFTAMALANLVAMPLWGRYGDARGHLRALSLAALGSGAALLLNGFAPVYLWLVGSRVALSLAASAMGPCALALATTEMEEHRRGAALGAMFSARTFATALSAVGGGVLSGWFGLRGVFLLGGAALLLAAGFGLLMRRLHRPRTG